MEAWEHIAPELPPGGEKAAGGWFIWGKWRGRSPDFCWSHFDAATGITRKAYAELIAPGLVREAAIEKHGRRDLAVQHTHGDGIQAFEVLRWGKVLARGIGYDLCDAAWACIQALGGGE